MAINTLALCSHYFKGLTGDYSILNGNYCISEYDGAVYNTTTIEVPLSHKYVFVSR